MKRLKPIVADLKIIWFVYKLAHRLCPSYLPLVVCSALVNAVMPFVNLIMLKLVIDELTGGKRIDIFVYLVLIAVLGNFVLNVLGRILQTFMTVKDEVLMNGFDLMVGEKIMALDFEMIEDPDILDLKERALFPVHNQGAFRRTIAYATTLLTNVITMLGLIAMLFMLNPLIVVFLFVMALVTTWISKKAQKFMYKFFQLLIPVNRKFGYYANVTTDFSYGKDIRLYKMDDLLMERIDDYNKTTLSVFTDLYVVLGRYLGYNEGVLQFQTVLVYFYMAYKVVTKSIGLGDFTMYASAATQFGQCLSSFGSTYMEMSQMCRYLESYLEFDALKPKRSSGSQALDSSAPATLEFKGVSFKYPKSETYALKDVNITIVAGEKLSIVGLNGAGKTTFIKLLTRLYEPTEGGIYLNGVNILEYDLKSYLELMSVVFQDFKLLAFSIKENIVFDEVVDDEVVLSVLAEAGFEQDLKMLPKGIATPIYKTFEEDGIEFSGGQSQKLAIARAIYKDSPMVILDEPTSALDPIAEYEIYRRFNELVSDKTTIYISHRLSSCLFCDRVAVFKAGEMIELGTHQELVKLDGGLYQEMYAAQAKYYV